MEKEVMNLKKLGKAYVRVCREERKGALYNYNLTKKSFKAVVSSAMFGKPRHERKKEGHSTAPLLNAGLLLLSPFAVQYHGVIVVLAEGYRALLMALSPR